MDKNRFYLQKIREFQNLFKDSPFKIIVGGGFAIDGFLKRLTREHEDLDLDVVGDLSWQEGFEQTEALLKSACKDVRVKKDRFEVWFGNLWVDLEYVQRLKETDKELVYSLSQEKFSFPLPFYLYNRGKINNLVFHVENPHYLFAIKYLMPISGKKEIRVREKEDIKNLLPVLDKKDLIETLRFQLNYIEERL